MRENGFRALMILIDVLVRLWTLTYLENSPQLADMSYHPSQIGLKPPFVEGVWGLGVVEVPALPFCILDSCE